MRPDGFYWVRPKPGALQLVAELRGEHWYVAADPLDLFSVNGIEPLVTSGRLTEPGERMGFEELTHTLDLTAQLHGYSLAGHLTDIEPLKKGRKE